MYRCSDLPGILLIHGFGGNRSEVRPLADHLRGLGCEVVSVQLPGHREDRRALGGPEAKAKLWQEFVVDQMKALHERGVAVPEQVSVIGFDDIAIAPYTVPALSSVKIPVTEMIQEIIGRLIFMLDGGDFSPPKTFSGKLIRRDSLIAPSR